MCKKSHSHRLHLLLWQRGSLDSHLCRCLYLFDTDALHADGLLVLKNGVLPAGYGYVACRFLTGKAGVLPACRILGKIGGVPALPGMGAVPVPPKGQILKATASPAAREIYYSKVEEKDAA